MNDNIICTVADKIPDNRFITFNEILIACGGRYTHRPQHIGKSFFVEYKFVEGVGTGYADFCERWNRAQLHIIEKRSGWFRCIWRRIKGGLK